MIDPHSEQRTSNFELRTSNISIIGMANGSRRSKCKQNLKLLYSTYLRSLSSKQQGDKRINRESMANGSRRSKCKQNLKLLYSTYLRSLSSKQQGDKQINRESTVLYHTLVEIWYASTMYNYLKREMASLLSSIL